MIIPPARLAGAHINSISLKGALKMTGNRMIIVKSKRARTIAVKIRICFFRIKKAAAKRMMLTRVIDEKTISNTVQTSFEILPPSLPFTISIIPLHRLSVEAETFRFVKTQTPISSLSENTILDE